MMTLLIPFAASGANDATQSASVFPPLDPWHFPSQIFWTLLLFAFLYFMLSRFILPKLGSTIETRQSTLADDLDDAQRFSDEADSAQKALEVRMAEARGKARETADAARAKIDADLAAQTAKVDADINTKLEAAEARITELRTSAMANVAEIATDTVQVMTDRLGVKTTKTAAKSAVGSVLKG
jgi:F-type H+-transporting ATPase subunit b